MNYFRSPLIIILMICWPNLLWSKKKCAVSLRNNRFERRKKKQKIQYFIILLPQLKHHSATWRESKLLQRSPMLTSTSKERFTLIQHNLLIILKWKNLWDNRSTSWWRRLNTNRVERTKTEVKRYWLKRCFDYKNM